MCQQYPPMLAEYVNLTRCVALPISCGMATLHEMQTVYGVGDAFDMLEVIAVDNFNRRQWAEWQKHDRR